MGSLGSLEKRELVREKKNKESRMYNILKIKQMPLKRIS